MLQISPPLYAQPMVFRVGFLSILLSFIFSTLPLGSQELRVQAEFQGCLLDGNLAKLSPGGFGWSLGLSLLDALVPNLSLDVNAFYQGYNPAPEVPTMGHAVYGVLNLGYGWFLDPSSFLGVYGGGGYGACFFEYDGLPISGGQALAIGGLRYGFKLSPEFDLSARLGVRGIFEAKSAFWNPELRLGASLKIFDFTREQGSPASHAPASVSSETPAQKLVPESGDIAQGKKELGLIKDVTVIEKGALEGLRIVIYSSFEANEVILSSRFYEQFPAIVKYLQGVPNLTGLDILGYVADDGSRNTGLELSLARAQLVEKFITAGIKPKVLKTLVKGMGKENPIAENGTEEGRRQNRRIEIVLHVKSTGVQNAK